MEVRNSTGRLSNVSVGIPFYARTNPHELRLSVDSILSQSYEPYEVLLVQDGPIGDQLKGIISDYTEKHSCVRLLRLPKKSGLVAALNESIRASTGDYYARMDSDDIAHQDRLRYQVEHLDNNPETHILGTWAVEFKNRIDEPGRALRRTPLDLKAIHKAFHYSNPLIHPSVMFRRTVFDKIGMYDPRAVKFEDLELWGRAIAKGMGIANVGRPLMYYRTNGMAERRANASKLLELKVRRQIPASNMTESSLKLAAILFRYMPIGIQQLAYSNVRRRLF